MINPGAGVDVQAGASAASTVNTLSFAQFGTGVALDLNQTGMQSIGGTSSLKVTGAFQTSSAATGNDVLTAAPNSTVYGGGGNDVLKAVGGSNIMLVAGKGNATLSAVGGSNIQLFGGGDSNNYAVSNGSSITSPAAAATTRCRPATSPTC